MSVKHVDIPSIGTVAMYKRKGNRSLRLSVGLNGEIRVSLPYWVPYRAAEEFVKTKSRWIHENVHKQGTAPIAHGEHIGKNHRIYFSGEDGRKTISTKVYSSEIYVLHPVTVASTHETVQSKARQASIRALKREAEKLLPERLNQLAAEHFFSYKNVTIKQLKSRWGSCSSQKEITLNLFLMQLPWPLIDYVLLHELTHTKVMRHGPPFWKELEEHLPNAKGLRNEINTYQPILTPKPLTVA